MCNFFEFFDWSPFKVYPLKFFSSNHSVIKYYINASNCRINFFSIFKNRCTVVKHKSWKVGKSSKINQNQSSKGMGCHFFILFFFILNLRPKIRDMSLEPQKKALMTHPTPPPLAPPSELQRLAMVPGHPHPWNPPLLYTLDMLSKLI